MHASVTTNSKGSIKAPLFTPKRRLSLAARNLICGHLCKEPPLGSLPRSSHADSAGENSWPTLAFRGDKDEHGSGLPP
jgi:hypothetical protein